MPDRGQRRISGGDTELADTGSWTLRGARWLQLSFEASRDAVLGALPCDVTRTVPCYARLLVIEAAESPAGPLRMAMLGAGGRYEMQPRNIAVSGVVDGDAARVAAALGTTFAQGAIELLRDGARVSASIGDGLARIELPAMRAVDSTMLRWDSWMGVAAVDGEPRLVDYTIEPTIDQAFLAKGATLETTGANDSTWRQFRCLNMISACYAEGTFTFGAREAREAVIE